MLASFIRFFLDRKLVTFLVTLLLIGLGLSVAPFRWDLPLLPSDPIPVDAIPDIGENQQIVYTEWMGRSPEDVEAQITYPLTSSLLGLPGVKAIRSTSMFGFSNIYVIFEEDVEYYWSRSRILEKINALPENLLPDGVQPRLGPDATALGQVFWYTLEVQDEQGRTVDGVWDLHELRAIQDFQVKPALSASAGVSEVASVGGHVMEYQLDLDPQAMRFYEVDVMEVMEAIRGANRDVGAGTMEINQVEYVIRGLGYIQSMQDLEESVIKERSSVPIRIQDIGKVTLGPAPRAERGILDKNGREVTGGVVVARYGDNPMQVIDALKAQIELLKPALPSKVLEDGRTAKVTVVPFYDRSQLIDETLQTLNEAIFQQIGITILVILVMVGRIRSSLLISVILPIAVLGSFMLMRFFGVDANIVALSGIAIAIGTLVDLGIILTENIHLHDAKKTPGTPMRDVVYKATVEIAPAIITAVSTTIISFLPVFTLQAAEGKLFSPLAYTKTFALFSAVVITLVVLPALAHVMYRRTAFARLTDRIPKVGLTRVIIVVVGLLVSMYWLPLGRDAGLLLNLIFTSIVLVGVLGGFYVFLTHYQTMLEFCLQHKKGFLTIPVVVVLWGSLVWLGFPRVFGWVSATTDAMGVNIRTWSPWSAMAHTFPGLGKEFMPSLDEGAFLYMPTMMPHAGVEVTQDYLSRLDRLVATVPEVETVVGKAGRAESALDPAPLSMFENVILYKPEYGLDENGQTVRNWRDHIQSTDDIWNEITKAASLPGLTSAPKLQPIETRLVMLQTGMRAPMGIKVYGPDIETIEEFSIRLERLLKQIPGIKSESVYAERNVAKPYLEIRLNRTALARYGIRIDDVQDVIEMSIGGMVLSTTVEGRERYAIRARMARDYREHPEALKQIPVPTTMGKSIPLGQVAEIEYRQGPMMIRSEDAFLTGYVLFDRKADQAEVNVVEEARAFLKTLEEKGILEIPTGVRYTFSGNYENQLRAEQTLSFVIPLCLALIFLILYFQFKSTLTSLMIFSMVAMTFSGGFIMIWLYGQPWFLDFSFFGHNLRDVFQMEPIYLSVAVWVGFIALFGIATDDGVVMGSYLDQVFEERKPATKAEIHAAVVEAGIKRIRPCLMTTATTLLALLPILTSTGRGSDIMIPMAIPAFGGMILELATVFLIPVLYAWRAEVRLKKAHNVNALT